MTFFTLDAPLWRGTFGVRDTYASLRYHEGVFFDFPDYGRECDEICPFCAAMGARLILRRDMDVIITLLDFEGKQRASLHCWPEACTCDLATFDFVNECVRWLEDITFAMSKQTRHYDNVLVN